MGWFIIHESLVNGFQFLTKDLSLSLSLMSHRHLPLTTLELNSWTLTSPLSLTAPSPGPSLSHLVFCNNFYVDFASTIATQQPEWSLKNIIKILNLSCLKGFSGFLLTVQDLPWWGLFLPGWPCPLCHIPQITLLQCCRGLECQPRIVRWPGDLSGLTPTLHYWAGFGPEYSINTGCFRLDLSNRAQRENPWIDW